MTKNGENIAEGLFEFDGADGFVGIEGVFVDGNLEIHTIDGLPRERRDRPASRRSLHHRWQEGCNPQIIPSWRARARYHGHIRKAAGSCRRLYC